MTQPAAQATGLSGILGSMMAMQSVISSHFSISIRHRCAILPVGIVKKPSSADLFGMSVPNEAFIGLNYQDLDIILTGMEKGYSASEIERMTDFKRRKIEAVLKMVQVDKIRKNPALESFKRDFPP